FGASGTLTNVAKGTPKITRFFGPSTTNSGNSKSEDSDNNERETRMLISLKTAKRWLNILGCQFKNTERVLEQWMVIYKEKKIESVLPMLRESKQELMLVTYDECIFYANDAKKEIWGMASNNKVRCYLTSSKNDKDYWTIKHLLKQIKEKAILIFKAKFSGATAVFAFDNSMNYAAFAKDALIVQRMNKEPRRKQSIMWPTTFIDINSQYFVSQKSVIVELIKGVAKRYARDHCDYTWTGLQKIVLQVLELLYYKGLTRKLAEYVYKKFKFHRRVPQDELGSFI
ncbi:22802_t:CDS:2, partial [Cetraspora pellucida]